MVYCIIVAKKVQINQLLYSNFVHATIQLNRIHFFVIESFNVLSDQHLFMTLINTPAVNATMPNVLESLDIIKVDKIIKCSKNTHANGLLPMFKINALPGKVNIC